MECLGRLEQHFYQTATHVKEYNHYVVIRFVYQNQHIRECCQASQALFRELLCVALGVRLGMVGEKYGCLRKAVVINLQYEMHKMIATTPQLSPTDM